MKVYNDLLLAADNGDVSALCLLDLIAAFDTVDHDLMMLKLERQFGLRGLLSRVIWAVVFLLSRIESTLFQKRANYCLLKFL